jgi:hypothetical protein
VQKAARISIRATGCWQNEICLSVTPVFNNNSIASRHTGPTESTTVKSPTLKSRIQANAAIKTQVTRKIQQYPKVPNAATCAAMKESCTMMTTLSVRFESARKLFTDLEKNSSK